MPDEAADQVQIEGARDGLREKERVGRDDLALSRGEGAGREVVPGDVRGDDIGREVLVDENVAPLAGAPEREVQEQRSIPAPRRFSLKNPERVVRAKKDRLQLVVKTDMAERTLVVDDELAECGAPEDGRALRHPPSLPRGIALPAAVHPPE